MPEGHRHYLLYARQNWRDSRVIVVFMAVAYAGVGLWFLSHGDSRNGIQLLVLGPAAVLLLPLIYLWTRVNYVDIDPRGVTVRLSLKKTTVPWDEVERAHMESMERIFEAPERRRLRSGIVRRLYREQAVCVRVHEDGADVLRKRLGARTIPGRELVLPVTEGETAMAEIKRHLTAQRRRELAEVRAARPGRSRRRGR